jgi:hypothetical protein
MLHARARLIRALDAFAVPSLSDMKFGPNHEQVVEFLNSIQSIEWFGSDVMKQAPPSLV